MPKRVAYQWAKELPPDCSADWEVAMYALLSLRYVLWPQFAKYMQAAERVELRGQARPPLVQELPADWFPAAALGLTGKEAALAHARSEDSHLRAVMQALRAPKALLAGCGHLLVSASDGAAYQWKLDARGRSESPSHAAHLRPSKN